MSRSSILWETVERAIPVMSTNSARVVAAPWRMSFSSAPGVLMPVTPSITPFDFSTSYVSKTQSSVVVKDKVGSSDAQKSILCLWVGKRSTPLR